MSELLGLAILLLIALGAILLLLTTVLAHQARRPHRRTAAYAVARGLAVDPGERGLAFEDWMLDRPDGATIPVWEIEAGGNPRRPGLTAVFLHGWGQSRIDLLTRADGWRDHVERMVMIDLRGHGDAGGGPSRLGDRESDDLLALLDRLGHGPFLLVGVSMGAVIAIRAAAADPRPSIAGVIAYGPYVDFHASIRGRLRADGYPTRPFTDLAIAWWRLCGIRPLGVEDAAASLRCPLLVVHGSADDVCPRWHSQRIVELAPDARLLSIEGAGHADAHTHDATTHDESIAGFIDALTTGIEPRVAAGTR